MVDANGDYESLSGGTGSGSAGDTSSADTGFPPNVVACDFELGANPLDNSPCSVDADCCVPPLVALDYACPSDEYPNNWRCESGECVQRSSPSADEGCSIDDDCLFPGFICAEISGVGHCVAPCSTAADCLDEHNMPNTTCEPVGGHQFCMQEQP